MMMRWTWVLTLVGMVALGGACSPPSTSGTGGDGCASVKCNLPPGASCDENVAVVYHPEGVCESGECLYTELRTECSVGLQCDQGSCVVFEDPCAGVRCDSPPKTVCNASDLVVYPEEGTCAEGECVYSPIYTPCGDFKVCMNAECVSVDDPCAMTVCDTPPSPVCEGNSVMVYGGAGTCAEGVCEYPVEATPCGGTATCVEGVCDDSVDPCEGVVCDSAPENLCALDTVIMYSDVGQCEAGECRYPATEEVCLGGDVCRQGACVDPCEGVACEAPPPPLCIGNSLRTHASVGRCEAGDCKYEEVDTPCGGDKLCYDGKCLFFPQVGDLIVTEVMYDPTGADTGYEWFELHNPTERGLYIGGLTISDRPTPAGSINQLTLPEGTFIAEGAYLVLGQSVNALPVGVGVDWSSFGNFTLANNDDELILRWGPIVIERVDYNENQGFPEAQGVSLSLDAGLTALENDGGGTWCFGVSPYFGADDPQTSRGKGSPGEANPPCDFLCFDVTCPALESGCLSNTVLLDYSGPGLCDGQSGLCSSEGVAVETDCVETHGGDLNYVCREGECVDGCDGVSCDHTPVSACADNGVVEFTELGYCVAGGCEFDVREVTPCGEDICVADEVGARCLPDPCLGLTCLQGPAVCDGEEVVSSTGDGVCVAGVCDFSGVEERMSCPVGESCFGGECYRRPAPLELVITEYLANPEGHDDRHEWFEIHNRTSTRLYLGGMVVKDLGSNEFVVDPGVFIEPGAYFVFGRSALAVPGGPDVDWSGMGFFQLGNGDDEIILEVDSLVIDALYYDHCAGCFPSGNGKSVSLEPTLIPGNNQESGNWCVGSTSFGEEGSYGSPGSANPPCFPCELVEDCLVPGPFCLQSGGLVRHSTAACAGGVCDYGGAVEVSECGLQVCRNGACIDSPD